MSEIRWEEIDCQAITHAMLREDLADGADAICIRWWTEGEANRNAAVYWPLGSRIGVEAGGNADYSDTIGDGDAAVTEALVRYTNGAEWFE